MSRWLDFNLILILRQGYAYQTILAQYKAQMERSGFRLAGDDRVFVGGLQVKSSGFPNRYASKGDN